jgi:hypothetical protein
MTVESIAGIDDAGTRPNGRGGRTDQIGSYIPAVPTPDGEGFWGYTSVPDVDIEKWRAMRTLPVAEDRRRVRRWLRRMGLR